MRAKCELTSRQRCKPTTNNTATFPCPVGAVFGDIWEYGERIIVGPLVPGMTSHLGNHYGETPSPNGRIIAADEGY